MSVVISQKARSYKMNELPFKMNELHYKIKDVNGIEYLNTWLDNLNVELPFTTTNAFIRNFNINVNIDTTVVNNFTKNVPINLDVGFLKVSNAGQVIGDIRFYNKVLNETNWDETITPFGYGKWKELITGDYIYQKCLCKFVMQASLNADRPNARTYIHKIDVPDVTDRGTIELTESNQPYEVEFNSDRFFHQVPEVNVTLKSYSGVSGMPTIIVYDITTKGFKVTMKLDSDFVEGSVTYAARGY